MAFDPINPHYLPKIVVTDTDTNITNVLHPSRPLRPKLLLPKDMDETTTLEIINSQVSLASDEDLAAEALHNLQQFARKSAAIATLEACIKKCSLQPEERINKQSLKSLEAAVMEALRCFKTDQQSKKDNNISDAFHLVAKGYARLLPQASELEKDLLRQRIETYFHLALEFSPTKELKTDIYYNFALYYQTEQQYDQELKMWIACSECDSGWIAYNHMGTMYAEGKGVQADASVALEYFLKGADKGDEDATANAAMMYDAMRLSSKDLQSKNRYKKLAIEAYSKASVITKKTHTYANDCYFRANFLIGVNDDGVFAPKNSKKMIAVCKTALKADPKNYKIANALALATFFDKNGIRSANTLFTKASKLGSEAAASFLVLKTEKEKRAKLAEFLKNPDQIYTEKQT